MLVKRSSRSRVTFVIGWSEPRRGFGAGSVGSKPRSLRSAASASASNSSRRRASAASIPCFSRLTPWPAALRLSGGIVGRAAKRASTRAFDSRSSPRSAARSGASAMRSRAPASRVSRSRLGSATTAALLERPARSGPRRPRLVHEQIERGRIVDRELGELLAVEIDRGLLQPVDERRVAHPAQPRRRVDADDPQAPELALLRATVARRVGPGAEERLAHRAPQLAAASEEALRLLEVPALLAPPGSTHRDACHGSGIQHALRERRPRGVQDHAPAQLATGLAVVRRLHVAAAGMAALHLPALRDLEALLDGALRLHLRHRTSSGIDLESPLAGMPRGACSGRY